MHLQPRKYILLWVAIVLLVPSMLIAQSTQGNILGTVKDSSGAVIPNAAVTLTETDTGVVHHGVTNAAGDYEFFGLTEGHYRINVTAQGFDAEVLDNLTLVARQQLRADAALHVGNVSQKVTVNAEAVGAISTETPTIDATYNAVDAQNLPANYRASQNGTSPLGLIQTLPGVQADTGNANGTGMAFSVQGGLPSQADVTIDGISVQNTTSNSPLQNAFPSGESISELRVEGVQDAAEFGAPGQITIISKSGTNDLHGSAFWYFQNSAFNATPFGDLSKPHIVGNDFGGSGGGPVVIPHLYNGRNRTFFFGTYEGFRLPSSTGEQYSVPTSEILQGNFSGVTGVQPLTNPFTGGTYANYTVPINAASQKFLQFFPTPNVGNVNAYTPGEINYITNKNTAYTSNQFDVRGDQYFGQKALVFARYTWKNISQNNPEPLNVPEGQKITQDRVLVVAGNYTFTPHLLNEFRFGFSLDTEGTTNPFNGPAFAQSTGLQGLQNLFFDGVPELDFNFLTSLNADRIASTTKSRLFEYTDAMTWTKGNHVMKYGFDIRHLEAITPLGFFGADNYGTFAFNTGKNFTGQEFADFLIGVPQATGYDVVQADNDGISTHYSFFAQDQWNATQRLTLSYGVRYDLQPGYHDPSGNIGNFDPSVPLSGEAVYPDGAQSTLAAGFLSTFDACGIGQSTGAPAANGAPCTPVLDNSQAGLSSSLRTFSKTRFMPRFGFAFRPFNDDRTAIRGGFSMYNITSLGSSFYSLTGTLQSATTEYTNSETPTGPSYAWPQIYAGQGVSSAAGNYGTAYFGTANSIHWKDPYSEQYSLSLDHEFGAGYGARISYIGMATHDLVWAPNLNNLPTLSSTTSAYYQPLSARPFPNWGTVYNRARPAPTPAITRSRSTSTIAPATVSPSTPAIRWPRTSPTTRARTTPASPVKPAVPALPTALTERSTSVRSMEPAAIAGTPPSSTSCPSAATATSAQT
jgi:Carboxypeptidase regulatory-like domain